jgi:hypothetical protein
VVEGFISPGAFFPSWVKATLGLTLGALFWAYLLRAGRTDAAPAPGSATSRGPAPKAAGSS